MSNINTMQNENDIYEIIDTYSVLCHLTLYVKVTSSGAVTPSSVIGVFSWFVTLANIIYNITVNTDMTNVSVSQLIQHTG